MSAEDGPLLKQVKDEISSSLAPVFIEDPELEEIYNMICVPDFIHIWKATWEDDNGKMQVNTCYRVQQNSCLGPYKGGLRFDSSVNQDTFRFLALEQTFKNALTTKPIGGAKGGSDFSPKNKSDAEIRRFCDSFMLGLKRVIGANFDVPAGDIGVDSKTIGYLFGSFRRFGGDYEAALSGKSLLLSGSRLRTEATGFGIVYLLQELLKDVKSEDGNLKGKTILISGSGNVATYTAKKCIELGGKVVSLSDRSQTYFCKEGFSDSMVDSILSFKKTNKKPSDGDFGKIEFLKGQKPWTSKPEIKADIALPCATQNEIEKEDAEALIKRGCKIVVEGSNLSSTFEAVEVFKSNEKVLDYVGSKLANLGGVATSFLEMAQNAQKETWSEDRVDEELRAIMKSAYKTAKEAAVRYKCSITDGANIAAFLKVADAMKQLGYARI